MGDGVGGHPTFTQWGGRSFGWGPGDGSTASFGGQVLDGVVSGLGSFLDSDRWRPFRRGPAVLGCTPWLSDADVVAQLARFSECCIVINKPESDPSGPREPHRQALRLRDEGPGFALDALPRFEWLAPRVDGRPAVVGPSDRTDGHLFASVRVAGMSKRDARQVIPMVHAKLLLLGVVHETDEHPSGAVVDYRFFEPRRVWMGSANLTANSRRSLEFGVWSDDHQLVERAGDFLVDLLTYSEPLGSPHAGPEPEFDHFEFDEEAMREAAAALLGEYAPDDE